ncbi:MAG TPA: hypothetical protein VGK04_03525 [Thermoanaerobaculia bacterium]|jgi:hypothetical protein
MNFAHLHLVLTHFPPVLSLGGAISAAAGVLVPRRHRELIQLALLLLIVVGATMPLVYIAGERAADSIGRVEGIRQDAIAPHQQAATIALSASIGAAFIAVALLVVERRRGSLSPALRLLVLVVAIGSAAAIGWTAGLGGAIHHPEIHS